MTDLNLEAIRERAAKATPGPWETEVGDAGHSRYEMNVWITTSDVGDVVCDMDGLARSHNERYDDDGYADAQFIAHAREDIPAILAEIDRLRVQIAEAWDEGFQDGRWAGSEGDDGPLFTNPYLTKDDA